MIVRNSDDFKKYISANVSYNVLKPYVKKAERKLILANIGAEQYAIFDVAEAPSDAVVKLGYELAQETICNYVMYLALPEIAAQVSDSGIFNAQNENVTTASDKQFKELQRSFKRGAHESLDDLFLHMEENLAKFDEWKTNDVYKQYTKLLVNSTAVFNKHYNIFNSRQTFMALKAEIDVVEYQFVVSKIQESLLTALKTSQTNDNRKAVKELLQKAIVCYTIGKVSENGMFVLDATGMHVRFDVLPYENVNSNINQKGNFLEKTRINKVAEAEQFVRLALEKIIANPSDFEEYDVPTETEVNSTLIETLGVKMI